MGFGAPLRTVKHAWDGVYSAWMSVAGCIFYLGQELSVKPLACLVPTAPTAHGGSKEDLLAMKDTARRAGLYIFRSPVGVGFRMPNKHISGLFKFEGSQFQAICSCGWLSTISFLEEVDLLRAMHAHAYATFKSYQE